MARAESFVAISFNFTQSTCCPSRVYWKSPVSNEKKVQFTDKSDVFGKDVLFSAYESHHMKYTLLSSKRALTASRGMCLWKCRSATWYCKWKFQFIRLLRTISSIYFSVRENETLKLNNCKRLPNSKNGFVKNRACSFPFTEFSSSIEKVRRKI